jgi:hypothetical protein
MHRSPIAYQRRFIGVAMDIDTLASLALADRRLTDAGYPRGEIQKGGSVELQSAFLAADVCRRAAELVEAVRGRLDALRTAVDANALGIAQIQTADLQHRLALANARPAGRA